jgi:hypothetical protein
VLSPLAVMPERQKRGIGPALVRHGLKALAERDVPLVFLEDDPRYYSRLGFAPGCDQGFRKPSLRIPDGAFRVGLRRVVLAARPSTPAVDRDLVAEAPRPADRADEIDLGQRGRSFILRLPESAGGGNP